jgi:hypothetical protein
MKAVNIVIPFTLTHDDGSKEPIAVGMRMFDETLGNFWYVEAHSDKPQKVAPAPGTPEMAAFLARRERRRRMIDALIGEEEDDEKLLGVSSVDEPDEPVAASTDEEVEQGDDEPADEPEREPDRTPAPRRRGR